MTTPTDGAMAAGTAQMRLAAPGTRIVLIGTGRHDESSTLPPLPSVHDTLADLRDRFVECCGVSHEQVILVEDPKDPDEMYAVIDSAARAAGRDGPGSFVLVYVGHGVKDSEGRTLFLATKATRNLSRHYPESQALAFSRITAAMRNSLANPVLFILDCCFSGLAPMPVRRNGAVIASTDQSTISHAPVGARNTAFAGEIITLLQEASQAPERMTVAHLASALDQRCRAAGWPPSIRFDGSVAGFVVAPGATAWSDDAGPRHSGGFVRPSAGGDSPTPSPSHPECPYPGLVGYELEDSWCFFGRDSDVDELAGEASNALYGSVPLVLVGRTGVGKSSLLRAGLLAGIRHGALDVPGSDRWPHLVMTPGSDPLATFRQGLAAIVAESGLDVRVPALLSESEQATAAVRSVMAALDAAAGAGAGRLVIVVDQAEELLTQCTEGDRDAFRRVIDELCRSGDRGGRPLSLVVMALRDDFLGEFAAWDNDFHWADHPTTVKPLSPRHLADAIRMPAAQVGVVVEEDLVRLLVGRMSAGEGRPGPEPTAIDTTILPGISHALRSTWHAAAARLPAGFRRLTREDYERTGGVAKVVALAAEAIYLRVPSDGRAAVRRLFVHRLLAITDAGHVVRRRLPLVDALGLVGRECLDAFREARLITVRGENVQIVQETLQDMWPRLRDWLNEERAGALVHGRLAEEAAKWGSATHKHRMRRGYLLGGRSLTDAQDWASDPEHLARLSATEHAFYKASGRRHRALVRFGVTAGTLAVAATIAIGALGRIADVRAHQTAQQTRQAQAKGLLADADVIRDSDPRSSLLLDVEAGSLGGRASADQVARSLASTLATTHYAGTVPGQDGQINAVALSPDGRLLAAACNDGAVLIWDLSGQQPRLEATRSSAHGAAMNTLAFSPSGRLLAAGGADDVLTLWDVSDEHAVAQRAQVAGSSQINSLAFSGDGRMLAVAYDDGTAQLRDATDLPGLKVFSSRNPGIDRLTSIAISADGRRMAAGSIQGDGAVWEITDPRAPGPVKTLRHGERIDSITFSPDGSHLVTAGADGYARLWNTADLSSATALTGHVGAATVAKFSPDGSLLAVGGADGSTTLWNARALPQPTVATTVHAADGAVTSLVFLPDGSGFVTGQADGAVDQWSVDPTYQPGKLATVDTAASTSTGLHFAPNGRLFARETDSAIALFDGEDPRSPTPLSTIGTDGSSITSFAFSADGTRMAVGMASPLALKQTLVALYDLGDPRRPRQMTVLAAGSGQATAVAYDPTGTAVAAGTIDGSVVLWRTDRGPSADELVLHDPGGPVASLAFSPNGKLMAAGIGKGNYAPTSTVDLSDTSDPSHPHQGATITESTGTVLSLAFSPGGAELAGASSTGGTYLWDLKDLGRIVVAGQIGVIDALTYSSDGTILAGATQSGQVAAFDVRNPKAPNVIATLPDPRNHDTAAAFLPTSQHVLATADSDGLVTMWDLGRAAAANRDPTGTACAIAGPFLSRGVWNEYASFLPYRRVCP
jgi:WD40 repeat protein